MALENHVEVNPLDRRFYVVADFESVLVPVPKAGASTILRRFATGYVAGVPDPWFHRIAVVRNTWDRLVSCWHQKTQTTKARVAHLGGHPFSFWFGMPFEAFLVVVAANIRANHHFYPQLEWIGEYDELWTTDELDEKWRERFAGEQPKRCNVWRQQRNAYQNYYNGYNRDLVADLYADEIAAFGFKF